MQDILGRRQETADGQAARSFSALPSSRRNEEGPSPFSLWSPASRQIHFHLLAIYVNLFKNKYK